MLKTSKITINRNNYTLKYYTSKGYDTSNKSFEIDINDLPIQSTIKVDVICDVCTKPKLIQYRDYMNSINNGGYYACCSKCALSKKEITSLTTYGYTHPSKSDIVKSRQSETNIKIYNYKTPLLNPDIKIKIENTLLLRYGVTHFSRSELFKPIKRVLNVENFNFCNSVVRLKASNTRKKFSIEKKLEIIKKINQTKNFKTINKWNNILTTHKILNYDGSIFIIKDLRDFSIIELTNKHFYNRVKLNIDLSFPIRSNISYPEFQIHQFLDSLNIEYKVSDRKLVNRKEIDIYIPGKNIAIEFNGIYWHSTRFKSKYYHYNKRRILADKNILLIDVWEDEWLTNAEQVKDRIKKLLFSENIITVFEPTKVFKLGFECWL